MDKYMGTKQWQESNRRAVRRYMQTENRKKTREAYELSKKGKLRRKKYKKNLVWYKKAVKRAERHIAIHGMVQNLTEPDGETERESSDNRDPGSDPHLFKRDAMFAIRSYEVCNAVTLWSVNS